MKWGILSDIHAHEHSDFAKMVLHNNVYINSRLKDILDTLWYCFETGHKKGVERWLILGDVFHTRNSVPTIVRNTMWDLLQKAHKEFGVGFIILVGNHDQTDKGGVIHSLHEWEGDFITIVDETLEVDSAFFIPYTDNHQDLQHCLNYADPDSESAILCMHAGVDGAAIGTMEYRIKDPLTVEDLHAERFAWVFLGHYHKPQSIAPNVVYVGSTCQLTRAEAGDKKRFLIYNTEDRTVKSLRTKCKEFHTVSWPLCREETLSDGYYDVVVSDETSPEIIRQHFWEQGISSVKVIVPPEVTETDARMEVDETTTDAELIQQYCKYKVAPKGADTYGLQCLALAKGAVASNLRLKFMSVSVRNFFSIKKAKLTLNQPGSVIAVLGENKDAEGFKSNGSGKSALLPESLFWCLYGETARDVPADDVVNNTNKRNCLVQVTLLLDKQVIQITRTRKHQDFGSSLYVTADGIDLTQGTVAATQVYLTQMLGMDYTTFSSVVAFSPETIRFVNSKDSEQKAVLDSILQTQRFGEALKVVRTEATLTRDNLTASSKSLEEIDRTGIHTATMKSAAESDLAIEKKDKKDWKAMEAVAVTVLRTTKAKALKDQDAALVKLNANKGLKAVVTTALETDLLTTTAALATVVANQTACKKDMDRIQGDLATIGEQEGRPCQACGQIILNMSKLKASLSSQLRVCAHSLESLKAEVNAAIVLKTKATTDLNAANLFNKTVTERTALRDALIKEIQGYQNDVTQYDEEILNRPVYDERRITRLTDRINELQTTLDTLKANRETAQREYDVWSLKAQLCAFWTEGFGNKGLKSFLLDNVLPHLTKYAQLFADRLTGNSVTINFSTVSSTGIDRFGVTAINSEGSDIYAGNSSGEKRRIDLSVMFALFMLANARVKLNLMLMDEVMDTLDTAGVDTVVEIMEEIARKRKLTIFVTSHTELADRLHESITVTKLNGLSTLS